MSKAILEYIDDGWYRLFLPRGHKLTRTLAPLYVAVSQSVAGRHNDDPKYVIHVSTDPALKRAGAVEAGMPRITAGDTYVDFPWTVDLWGPSPERTDDGDPVPLVTFGEGSMIPPGKAAMIAYTEGMVMDMLLMPFISNLDTSDSPSLFTRGVPAKRPVTRIELLHAHLRYFLWQVERDRKRCPEGYSNNGFPLATWGSAKSEGTTSTFLSLNFGARGRAYSGWTMST